MFLKLVNKAIDFLKSDLKEAIY